MKITTIGGGTGQSSVHTGLRQVLTPGDRASAIVTATDTGGGTGFLRHTRNLAGCIGDARRVVNAMAMRHEARFDQPVPPRLGGDRGVTLGHLIIADNARPGVQAGIDHYARLVGVPNGREVLAVTEDVVELIVTRGDSTKETGEHLLDDVSRPRARVTHAEHNLPAQLNCRVEQALAEADAVVVGPGDFYGSIITSLIVPGMQEVMRQVRGAIVCVLPLMTKCTDTYGMSAQEYVHTLESYLGRSIHAIIGNTAFPPDEVLLLYSQEHSQPMETYTLKRDGRFWGSNLVTVDPNHRVRHNPVSVAMQIRLYAETAERARRSVG